MVRRHPEWLADDGVHVSADGYAARARATARLVRTLRLMSGLSCTLQLSDGSAGIVAIRR